MLWGAQRGPGDSHSSLLAGRWGRKSHWPNSHSRKTRYWPKRDGVHLETIVSNLKRPRCREHMCFASVSWSATWVWKHGPKFPSCHTQIQKPLKTESGSFAPNCLVLRLICWWGLTWFDVMLFITFTCSTKCENISVFNQRLLPQLLQESFVL